MPDLATLGSMFGLLQTARDLVQGIISARDSVIVQSKVIELQGIIVDAMGAAMDARTEQAALLDRVSELEKEIAKLKTWEAEKQNYELKEVAPRVFAYSIKEAMRGTEPAHQICQNCYNNGFKSILQHETKFPGRCDVLACHACGSDIYLTGHPLPDHFKAKPSSRGRP
jgi:hypothetical protein